MTDEVQRDLGNHAARIDHLEDAVTDIAADVKAIRSKLDEAKGGGRVIMFLIGVSASTGGFIGWLISMLAHKPQGVP